MFTLSGECIYCIVGCLGTQILWILQICEIKVLNRKAIHENKIPKSLWNLSTLRNPTIYGSYLV